MLLARGAAADGAQTGLAQLLQEFRKRVGFQTIPCARKPECFCMKFSALGDLPIRFSEARYCPLPVSEKIRKIHFHDSWDATGHKMDSGLLMNNRPHGPASIWHPNGRLAALTSYTDGVQTGPFMNWHENGQISHIGQHMNGKPEGRWLIYSAEGNLLKTLTWKAGKLTSKIDG